MKKFKIRTIKSILSEYNRTHEFVVYGKTLKNTSFVFRDGNIEELSDEEKESIDDNLDVIDIGILCYDYNNYLIDKCLEDLIEYNEDSTEDENLLNFKNFIVKKECEILKQKIEEKKDMFVQERNTIYELLNNREKVKRRFKENEISKSKLVKKIDDTIAYIRRGVKINLKHFKLGVLKEFVKRYLDNNRLERGIIARMYDYGWNTLSPEERRKVCEYNENKYIDKKLKDECEKIFAREEKKKERNARYIRKICRNYKTKR